MLYYEKVLCPNATEWIVLIHGFGGSIKTWKKQIAAYSGRYNLIAIDLHGHGESKSIHTPVTHTMTEIIDDIISILDLNGIEEAHFAGLSLGTVINTAIASYYPERVKTMVLGGGVIQLDMRTKVLLALARFGRRFIPYMTLYRFFAHIVLPNKNHAFSRKIFIREASKLGYEEFCSWLNFLKEFRSSQLYIENINRCSKKIPTLYIMGSQDYLFLKRTTRLARTIVNTSVHTILNCGHVCNLERADEFNDISLGFIDCNGDVSPA